MADPVFGASALRSGFEAKKVVSSFPDRPVVNIFFTNDPDVFFNPDVRGHARTKIRRDTGDVKGVLFIRSRWIAHSYARDLPIFRVGQRAPPEQRGSTPHFAHVEREAEVRG